MAMPALSSTESSALASPVEQTTRQAYQRGRGWGDDDQTAMIDRQAHRHPGVQVQLVKEAGGRPA